MQSHVHGFPMNMRSNFIPKKWHATTFLSFKWCKNSYGLRVNDLGFHNSTYLLSLFFQQVFVSNFFPPNLASQLEKKAAAFFHSLSYVFGWMWCLGFTNTSLIFIFFPLLLDSNILDPNSLFSVVKFCASHLMATKVWAKVTLMSNTSLIALA